MKRILKQGVFVLAFVCTVMLAKYSVNAETILVNSKNFPDSNLRATLNYYTDAYIYDKDGVAKTDKKGNHYIDSKKVTSIFCYSNEGIGNLKGIDLFPNIKSIHIKYRRSVADFSSNKKIEIINMDAPRLVTLKLGNYNKVTSFSVASKKFNFDYNKLKNVNILSIKDSKAKKIDISKLKKLKHLSLERTSISSIDLSKMKTLTNFSSYYCQNLSNVTFGALNKLESVYLVGLPKIKTVDITKCKALCIVQIIDTSLSSIDLSKNTKLYSCKLNGNKNLSDVNVTKNSALESLNIGATNIKNIDTSKNSKLWNLQVYDTKISSLNLNKNKNLSVSNIAHTNITSLPIAKLYNNFSLEVDCKAGSSIDLSKYIGKGYKLEKSYDSKGFVYDSKNGILKVKKSNKVNQSYIILYKGNRRYNFIIDLE